MPLMTRLTKSDEIDRVVIGPVFIHVVDHQVPRGVTPLTGVPQELPVVVGTSAVLPSAVSRPLGYNACDTSVMAWERTIAGPPYTSQVLGTSREDGPAGLAGELQQFGTVRPASLLPVGRVAAGDGAEHSLTAGEWLSASEAHMPSLSDEGSNG